MVNVFSPVNEAMMLSSYPMKQIEPVVNFLLQLRCSMYFQADAANSFWTVSMYPPPTYRTLFSMYDGQRQYLRMGQALCSTPHKYAWMKNIFSGYIAAPNTKPTFNNFSSRAFECFVDHNFGAHSNFFSQFEFLYNDYFPHLMWGELTLKEIKSRFFLNKINPLEYESHSSSLRPTLDKVKTIREYPRTTCLAEIEQYLYLTIFLQQFIPRWVLHARILQEAVQYTKHSDGTINQSWIPNSRSRYPKNVGCGLKGHTRQETAFRAVKTSIIGTVVYRGDKTKQYHWMTDAATYAIGSVLFQLPKVPAETNMSVAMRKKMKLIVVISQWLSSAETRYLTMERKELAIGESLGKVQWLIFTSPYTKKVYTDHSVLVGLLKKDDPYRRIVRWQVTLSEYNIKYIPIPGT